MHHSNTLAYFQQSWGMPYALMDFVESNGARLALHLGAPFLRAWLDGLVEQSGTLQLLPDAHQRQGV